MTKTAPRINSQAAVFYPTVFKTLNSGLEFVLESYPTLYRRALSEAKNLFTDDELRLIVDVFNGTALTPGSSGLHLALSVEDSITLDGYDQKWNIDPININAKIAELSTFQTACLEVWANGFWYSKASQEKSLDIDAHIQLINPA